MQENHQAIRDKLDKCLVALQNTDGMLAKSTLWKFYENCRKLWVELDKEMIECRCRNRITQKYVELESKFNECVNNFEQWTTFAKLLY
jgi:hypothetical protein